MADPQKTPVCSLCAHTPICKNQPQESCPYLQLKDDRTRAVVKSSATPAKPQKTFWRKLYIWSGRVVIAACLVLSFIAGRFSAHPRIVSKLPTISGPVEPGEPPEEIIRQFIQAVRMHDVQKVMALGHPELIQEDAWRLTDVVNSGQEVFDKVKTFTILDIRTDETAIVTMSFETDEGTDTEEILLKKYQNEWRIVDFD